MTRLKTTFVLFGSMLIAMVIYTGGANATHHGWGHGHHYNYHHHQAYIAQPVYHHRPAVRPVYHHHRHHAAPVVYHHPAPVLVHRVVAPVVQYRPAPAPVVRHHHHRAHHHGHHAKWAPVIYKPGHPCKCGEFFFYDRKAKACKDARWK